MPRCNARLDRAGVVLWRGHSTTASDPWLHPEASTWTPKACKIMAFMAIIMGLGLLFYILLGLRYPTPSCRPNFSKRKTRTAERVTFRKGNLQASSCSVGFRMHMVAELRVGSFGVGGTPKSSSLVRKESSF